MTSVIYQKQVKRSLGCSSLFIVLKARIGGTFCFGLFVTDLDLTETELPSKGVGLCSADGHSVFSGLELVRAWIPLCHLLSMRLYFYCLLPSTSIHTLFISVSNRNWHEKIILTLTLFRSYFALSLTISEVSLFSVNLEMILFYGL